MPSSSSSASSFSLQKNKQQSTTSSTSSLRDRARGKAQREASESDRSQVNSRVVSPADNGSRSNTCHSRQDSISSQEGRGGGETSERAESRVSSYSRGSGESSILKTVQETKNPSGDTFLFTQYHSMRRPSKGKGFRNGGGGGRDTRKRRASSPATSYSPHTKRAREERASLDEQKSNIFSRLGPSSYTRNKDRKVDAMSESPSPQRSLRARSRGQDSSQERPQSPASLQHCSGSSARSSPRSSRRQSERGDERKKERSLSPLRRTGRSRGEREGSGERRRRCSYSSRSERRESERENSRRKEEEDEEEEEEGKRVTSKKRQRRRQSDGNSDSDREGDKSSGGRVKYFGEKKDGEGGSGRVEKIEREICNISWDEADTTADEMETLSAEKVEDSSQNSAVTSGESQVAVGTTEEGEKNIGNDMEEKDASFPVLVADKSITEGLAGSEEKEKEEGAEEEKKGLDAKKSTGTKKSKSKDTEAISSSQSAETKDRDKRDETERTEATPSQPKRGNRKSKSKDTEAISGSQSAETKDRDKRDETERTEATPSKIPGRQKRGNRKSESGDVPTMTTEKCQKVEEGAAGPTKQAADKSEAVSKVEAQESVKNVEVKVREKTPPPDAPPTSRDYIERDVTPPLEVLQSMQQHASFQSPFFSVPFPCNSSPLPTLTAFHPAHLFATGQHPVSAAPLPIPGVPISFPGALPQGGMAGRVVVSSPGMWPVHMAPASWQQLWLNQQRALGAGAPPGNGAGAPPGNEAGESSNTKTEPKPTVPAGQSEKQPEVPKDKTPQPSQLMETTPQPPQTVVENGGTVPEENGKNATTSPPNNPQPNTTENLPADLQSSTPTSGGQHVTVTQAMDKEEALPSLATEDGGTLGVSSLDSSQQGRLEGQGGEGGGGKKRRRMDAKCRQQYREMMDKFRRHAAVLALSTKTMIR